MKRITTTVIYWHEEADTYYTTCDGYLAILIDGRFEI
jgi:hypothetical protein